MQWLPRERFQSTVWNFRAESWLAITYCIHFSFVHPSVFHPPIHLPILSCIHFLSIHPTIHPSNYLNFLPFFFLFFLFLLLLSSLFYLPGNICLEYVLYQVSQICQTSSKYEKLPRRKLSPSERGTESAALCPGHLPWMKEQLLVWCYWSSPLCLRPSQVQEAERRTPLFHVLLNLKSHFAKG